METSPLDALLTDEQQMIAQAVAEFATDVVAPQHEAIDHAGVHPEDLWQAIAELGLFGAAVPEELGGAGAGCVGQVVVVESLARAGGVAGALACAQGIVSDAVVGAGSDEPRERWLEGLLTGETLGAVALAEDGWKTDCEARSDGDAVILKGVKAVVPFPGRAGCFVVRARMGEGEVLVLVPGDAAGVSHGEPVDAIGLRGFQWGALTLEDARGELLGEEDLVKRVVAKARVDVSALLSGVARGALDHATRYAGERVQFKRQIRDFSAIQEKLATGDARVEGVRGLVHGAARAADAGAGFAQAARRARHLAARVADQVTDDCVQVYGGYGYSREYPAERYYRDAMFCGFGEYHAAALFRESLATLEGSSS